MMRRARIVFFVAVLGLWALCGLALAEWTEPVPVEEINAEDLREWTPFLSYDGLSLYYAQGRGSSGRHLRIYRAKRNEPFGPFTSITEVLRSNDDVYGAWVSLDGFRVYYTGEIGGIGVRMSERTSVDLPWSWGPGISELNSLGTIFGASLTSDELTIVISSSNIPGGLGGRDIWMATRSDRNMPFSNVTNLSEINSSANDTAASISFDGLTIYFSSNRNGTGQLFTASRSSVDEPFGPPEHLPEFDTPGGGSSQPNISADGSTLYFIRVYATKPTDIYVSYLQGPFERAVINIDDALAEKANALEKVDAALEKEWTAYEALEELLESGDYGDLNKGDVVAAKQNIHSAIQLEEQSKKVLAKSIEKLEDALAALGLEPKLDPNLAAYWKFDEGEGTIAYDSADDNDGTVYGAQWTTGQIDGALSFDGIDDYVAPPENSPVWLPQYNFTLSAWVYFHTDPSPTSSHEFILDLNLGESSNPDNELGYGIFRREITGKLHFNMTTTTNADENLSSDDVLVKDKWYHIAAVRDGATQAIYIDGLLNASRTCSPDPIDFVGGYDDDKVNIGGFTRKGGKPSNFHLNGSIDDVRIYDRALSTEEIQQLYEDVLGPGKGKK